jgi:hypothetical protein
MAVGGQKDGRRTCQPAEAGMDPGLGPGARIRGQDPGSTEGGT